MTRESTDTAQLRRESIARAQQEAERWSRLVDSLLSAFPGKNTSPAILGARMEALRNKRDTFVTKVEALRRHRDRNWFRAREDLETAQHELQDAWRTVIGTLNKEGLFV